MQVDRDRDRHAYPSIECVTILPSRPMPSLSSGKKELEGLWREVGPSTNLQLCYMDRAGDGGKRRAMRKGDDDGCGACR